MYNFPSLTKTFSSVLVVISNWPLLLKIKSTNVFSHHELSDVPITAKLHFFSPNPLVELSRSKLLDQHGAVLVIDNTAQSIINQKSSQTKTDKETEQWNDCNPFFPRI